MPTEDAMVRRLTPAYDRFTKTEEMLDHARQQAIEYGLDDYFVVDVDSHREPDTHWDEVAGYIDNRVMRDNARHDFAAWGRLLYVPPAFPGGIGPFQSMQGRVSHQEPSGEVVSETDVNRDVVLSRRAMDAMGIDVQVVFPTSLLGLGMSPMPEGEAEIAYAYNRWMVDKFCGVEPRIAFFPYLPLRDPDMCLRIVRELTGKPGVVGFLVTSLRHDPVHHNRYMRLYAELEERGTPLAFHAGPTWNDSWMKTLNRFLSVHALSFVHCNMVHMTNWIINGLPERFPRLKTIWVESGLAWVPFLMQRLDHEYLKRTSEAPLLTRLPSDYMREMYYTTQPMEADNTGLLQATMTAIHAETQLLYASDWPHWDFDAPGSIMSLGFLSDDAKRNIIGLNAARLLGLAPTIRKTPTAPSRTASAARSAASRA